MVLMYHRIAEVDFDPWQLSVNPSNFEAQLNLLKQHYKVITTSELIRQVQNRKIERDCVCITFDDGYADNFLEAKPLLEKYKCPATFFIASNYIGSGLQFWWDELEDIILGSQYLPGILSIIINDKPYTFTIDDIELTPAHIEKQKSWEWPALPPTGRCKLYLEIWEILLPLEFNYIKDAIDYIRRWANYNVTPPKGKLPMTLNQLGMLAGNDLFEIGMHTSTHPALSFHTKEYQRMEIASCKNELQNNYPHVINAIAYPYGRFDQSTVTVLAEENIDAGFTTDGQVIAKRSDCYRLSRLQVNNWNADHFKRELKRWSKFI